MSGSIAGLNEVPTGADRKDSNTLEMMRQKTQNQLRVDYGAANERKNDDLWNAILSEDFYKTASNDANVGKKWGNALTAGLATATMVPVADDLVREEPALDEVA
ncbi:MAG: hypothetical protein CL570_06165 [Alphaproteobacteria bacterium]|nr:hypothetical protein [Alphaproteobacteria bacterium]|tara:strand:+ start:4292 stop:4603 length:312 start_codon:yes stop_codon:yes gene_type:complete